MPSDPQPYNKNSTLGIVASFPATAAAIQTTGGVSKPYVRNRKTGLTQAKQLRDLSHKLAVQIANEASEDKEDKRQRARDVALLVRAWSEAAERVRILQGRPLPGVLRPDKKKPRTKSTPQPVVSCGTGTLQPVNITSPARAETAISPA